jgi:CRISPR/Cas system-associated exonuclease Cas4 (RecB family)
MPTLLYRRALNRAAEILGGEERLARFLNAEQNELRYWKQRQPPVEALQLVAGLLMHQLLKKYDQSAIRPK